MAKEWWSEYEPVSMMDAALQAEGIKGKLADLARSIYQQESSSGKNAKTSNAGAVGAMQIKPSTFREVADKGWDINSPLDNVRAGVRYLEQMYDRAKGDAFLAAAGYYGGPGGQDKAKKGEAVADPRNPKAPNTLEYAQQVVARLPKSSAGGDWWQGMPEAQKTGTPKDAAKKSESPKPGPSEAPGLGGEVARQLGLLGRATVNGVASLPAMASDAITGPVNAALDAVRGKGNGFRFQRASAALNNLMTEAGVPEPKNATERVVQDVTSAMAGTGSTVAAGKVLEKGSNAVARRVGQLLADGPGLQTVSTATGTGAAGITRENGGSEGAQMAAAVLGGIAPSVVQAGAGAAVRGALRGGEAGRKEVADRVAAFRAAGVEPTVGQATEGRIARAAESMLSKVPGGAGVMSEFANQQADDMAASVKRLSDDLAPNASAVNAGEAIVRGVNTFRDGVKKLLRGQYANLDKHIPADTPIDVGNTKRILAELNASIPGAEQTSSMFGNTRIAGIEEALLHDMADDGRMPYEAIKTLRTLVGQELTNNTLTNDVPRAKWAALYGALSDDLGAAAKAAGPDAAESWILANAFNKKQMQRLDDLQGIVDRDTAEKVFNAAVSGTAEGDTIAKRVMSAIPTQERREVAAALLQRLGRATPGQQNAAGDAFSSESFLTNLSKLSPEARKTIFSGRGMDGVLEQLDNFAQVAGSRREGGRIFGNPSGTAPAAAQMGTAGAVGAGAVAALAGNPVPLAGALSVPAVANLGAKTMTNQNLVDLAATATHAAPGTEAALVRAAGEVDPAGTMEQPAPAAPQGGNWWDAMPEVDPTGGFYQRPSLPMMLEEEGIKPTETRSQLERIGDAQSVAEAIRAISEPDHIGDMHAQAADKRTALEREIDQLRTMRDERERIRESERIAQIQHEREMLGLRSLDYSQFA